MNECLTRAEMRRRRGMGEERSERVMMAGEDGREGEGSKMNGSDVDSRCKKIRN